MTCRRGEFPWFHHPSTPPLPPCLCPPPQTGGHIKHIFRPTVLLRLSDRTFDLKSSPTNPLTDSQTDVYIRVLLRARVLLRTFYTFLTISHKYLCQIVGGILRVY